MITEHRVDRLARRLARPDMDLIVDSAAVPGSTVAATLDGVARALGAPVTRRRAVAILAATFATGLLLRPARVRAQGPCPSGGPKVCTGGPGGGGRVCVPEDLACCSNENCAIACPYPWRECGGPAICNDTARLCTDRNAPGYSAKKTKFCSRVVEVTNGCVAGGTSMSRRGWCCSPNETCGAEEFGDCLCLTTPCDGDCCKRGEECVDIGLFSGRACLPACRPGWHHEGRDCVCDSGQQCGVNCCPAGSVCRGSACVRPPPSRLPTSFQEGLDNFGNVGNQGAGARGGGSSQSIGALQATGSARSALLLLAAVNAQGSVAGAAFAEERVDRRLRGRVVPLAPPRLRVPPGPGLDPRAAAALEALLNAEARGFALARASADALARARGAIHADDLAAARAQVRAAAGFAGRAATALRPVPSLRARAVTALTGTGTAEVVVTPEEVARFQAEVRDGGLPADLRDALRRVGVRGQDLPVVTALLPESDGGAALIAPLADPAQTAGLRRIGADLAQLARSARRAPVRRTRPRPRRLRAPAA